MRGQQDRAGNCNADLGRERVIKEFLVGAPPKWIVHHSRTSERGVLQPGAIKRNVLRNAIDHDIVAARFALDHFVDADELGLNVLAAGFVVHTIDKAGGKLCSWPKRIPIFFIGKRTKLWHWPQEVNSELRSRAVFRRESD